MTHTQWLSRLSLLVIVGTIACTKNTLTLPEPAQSVVGTYQTQVNSITLPTNNETTILTIKRTATDTVGVALRTSRNGQIIDSLSYQKAYIEQRFETRLTMSAVNVGDGCINYTIYLTPTKSTNVLTMTCSEVNVIYYSYIPSGQKNSVKVRFKKV